MNEIKTIRCKDFNWSYVKNSFYMALSDHISPDVGAVPMIG